MQLTENDRVLKSVIHKTLNNKTLIKMTKGTELWRIFTKILNKDFPFNQKKKKKQL